MLLFVTLFNNIIIDVTTSAARYQNGNTQGRPSVVGHGRNPAPGRVGSMTRRGVRCYYLLFARPVVTPPQLTGAATTEGGDRCARRRGMRTSAAAADGSYTEVRPLAHPLNATTAGPRQLRPRQLRSTGVNGARSAYPRRGKIHCPECCAPSISCHLCHNACVRAFVRASSASYLLCCV